MQSNSFPRSEIRIARKLSKLEPKVLLRNFPSVEQIQDKVPKIGWGAVRRVGRYNKNKSFQWKIENGKSLPSSSAEGWRSSRLRKTNWVPELRSRTTSAIHQCLFTSIPQESPSSRPSPSWGRRNSLYIQTSIPLYIHSYPLSGLRPPSPARGEGKKALPQYIQTSIPLYIHTSITTPHPVFGHPLPQEAREKTLAAQLPSCLAAFNGGAHD